MLNFYEDFEKRAERDSVICSKKKNKEPRFNSGTCLICNEHFDVLLNLHSQQHGDKNAQEQIDDNKVLFDWEVKECKRKN